LRRHPDSTSNAKGRNEKINHCKISLTFLSCHNEFNYYRSYFSKNLKAQANYIFGIGNSCWKYGDGEEFL
jgi:hypothetical protein